MDVQEVTARVTAFVKKHPYLSGAALLLVVVLGYIGYKNAGAGGSADAAPADTSVSQDFGAGGSGGSGGENGSSALQSDLFSQLYPIQQTEPAQMDTSGGADFGGGGGIDPVDFGGSYVPPADSGYIPYTPGPMTPAQVSETLAGGHSAGGLASVAPVSVSGWSAGGLAQTEKAQALAVSKAPAPVVPVEKKIATNTAGWSPARLLGKGQNYTGYIGAAYYVNGYPQSVTQQAMKNISQVTTVPKLAVSKQPANQKPAPLKKAQ